MSRRTAALAPVALAALGVLLTLLAGPALAGDKDKGRDDVATCTKIEGALLQRNKDGTFKVLKAGDHIPPHRLLVGLPEAQLLSSCSMVEIKLMLYLGDALPVTEAAVILNDSPELNADITVERGIVSLKGLNKKGDTLIRIRGGDQQWMLKLKEPDAQVLVARFGRHEPGTKLFGGTGKKEWHDTPLMHMGVLVLKGTVSIEAGNHTFALRAPPGPALITFDSGAGYDVKHLEKLPADVSKLGPKDAKNYELVKAMIGKMVAGDLGKGMDEMAKGDSELHRRVAVACMGALDDMPRLVGSLENPKYQDMRDQAILTLRNWIGREPGQLKKLYNFLTTDKKYTPIQARQVIHLLKGFDDQDRKEPIIYQMLIEGLDSGAIPVRELAHWHLERLAPAGQKIAYDAGADAAARQKAMKEWRELIPDGQLPPPPKKDEIKKAP
jgi:hypothetical protein